MKRYSAIGLTLVCGGLAAAAGADTIDVHAKGDLRAMWVSRCWAPLEKWLWHPAIKNGKATVFFRRELQIDSSMPRLVIEIAANNGYTLYVNGKKIAQELNKRGCYELRLNEQLQPGRNVVAIEAVNTGGPGAVICGFQAYRRGSDQGRPFRGRVGSVPTRPRKVGRRPTLSPGVGSNRPWWPITATDHGRN